MVTMDYALTQAELDEINSWFTPTTTVPFVNTAEAKKLRKAAEAVDRAIAVRNAAILEAHRAGHSLRAIGDAVGVTHVAVLKVIRKQRRFLALAERCRRGAARSDPHRHEAEGGEA